MKRLNWLDRMLLRLMAMEVHSMVYIIVALSVWHGIETIINTVIYPPGHQAILLDSDAVNIVAGGTVAILGTVLIVLLAQRKWRWASYISMALLYLWFCVWLMLVLTLAYSAAVVVLLHVILYAYLAIGTSLHHHTKYPIKSTRREHYGSKD